MNLSIKSQLGLAALLLSALLSGCNPPTGDAMKRAGKLAGGDNAADTNRKYRIVVVPKDTSKPFWQSARRGAEDAAKKYNAQIIWAGPTDATNFKRQKEIVEEATAEKVDGIALAPIDATELVIPVNRAAKARIPVAIFDLDVNTFNRLTLVATDNYKAGQMAARRIGKITGGRGKVNTFVYDSFSSPAAIERRRGFMETIEKEFPGIGIGSKGLTAAFALHANATLSALPSASNKSKVKIVGFGSSPELAKALKAGEIDSLVLEDPYRMGYESVKAVVDYLQLRDVPKRIDSGVALVTKENMNAPENQKLLKMYE